MAEETEVKKSSPVGKIVVGGVIVLAIVYVIYDVLTQGCTITEPESDRAFRVLCDTASNSTAFTCTTSDDNTWAVTTVDGVEIDECSKDAPCVTANITLFLQWIEANPAVGAVMFSLVYVAATILFIPGSVLTIGAGVAFGAALGAGYGVLVGTLCVWLGANTGAAGAFILGRYLFRDWVAEQVKKVKTLTAIDKAIRVQGFKTVLLLRCSPVIPFNLFNYLMGATGVSFPNYVMGSLLGMLPGTAAYVFIGAAIGGASSNSDADSCNPDNTVKNVVLAVGVVATFAAVTMISFYAKKELNAVLEEDDTVEVVEVDAEDKA